MRLIDADLFMENARKELNCEEICGSCENDSLCEIYKMVLKQPTAYDADKVVEQLEELCNCEESRAAECDEAGNLHMMDIHDAKVEAYRNAERIVKEGGVDGQGITDYFQRRYGSGHPGGQEDGHEEED